MFNAYDADVCLAVCLQEKKIAAEIANLEKDTGFKLRVLAQNYPETPGEGLALMAQA